MAFDFKMFIAFIFVVATILFLFYFWMNWLRNKNFRFNELFMRRKPYYPQINKDDMALLTKTLQTLPLEERLHCVTTLLGHSSRVFLTVASDGKIYIDTVSVDELIEDAPITKERNTITG